MMTDNFIKALSVIKHKYFLKMIKIEDTKKNLLAFIKQKNNLKDAFQQRGTNINKLFGFEIAGS